jgi:hypothetical protein
MNSAYGILYALAAVGSIIIALAPFAPRYRNASAWLRVGLFLSALLGVAWAVLGFYLLLDETGDKTSLPQSRFWALDHMQSNIAGLAVGILVSLMLSPEARGLGRRKPSV